MVQCSTPKLKHPKRLLRLASSHFAWKLVAWHTPRCSLVAVHNERIVGCLQNDATPPQRSWRLGYTYRANTKMTRIKYNKHSNSFFRTIWKTLHIAAKNHTNQASLRIKYNEAMSNQLVRLSVKDYLMKYNLVFWIECKWVTAYVLIWIKNKRLYVIVFDIFYFLFRRPNLIACKYWLYLHTLVEGLPSWNWR